MQSWGGLGGAASCKQKPKSIILEADVSLLQAKVRDFRAPCVLARNPIPTTTYHHCAHTESQLDSSAPAPHPNAVMVPHGCWVYVLGVLGGFAGESYPVMGGDGGHGEGRHTSGPQHHSTSIAPVRNTGSGSYTLQMLICAECHRGGASRSATAQTIKMPKQTLWTCRHTMLSFFTSSGK